MQKNGSDCISRILKQMCSYNGCESRRGKPFRAKSVQYNYEQTEPFLFAILIVYELGQLMEKSFLLNMGLDVIKPAFDETKISILSYRD